MSKLKHLTIVDLKKIISLTGLFLHVPAVMALFSVVISLIFGEFYAIIPFILTSIGTFILGQLLYQSCKCVKAPSLWDSMAVSALSWFLCPLIAAIPFYWISLLELKTGIRPDSVVALTRPINAIFEAFSGFTSTGFTLVGHPSEYSNSIIWWRSFTQWVGGVGLIVFMLSVVNGFGNRYHLYYAETRTEAIGKNIKETTKTIWALYGVYTLLSIFLFLLAGMPLWESINHAMTGISTGGFGMKDDSFASYNSAIKVAAIVIMFAGSVSFVVHYHMIRLGNVKKIWTSLPHRFLLLSFFIGTAIIVLMDRHAGHKWSVIDSAFTWISAMSTTGWSVVDITTHTPAIKMILIIAMLMGGCSGSTAGGLKVQRILNIMASLNVRLKSILSMKTLKSTAKYRQPKESSEEPGLILPSHEQTRKLFASNLLFFLWIAAILLGCILLTLNLPNELAFNAVFESVSAVSNAGLTTNIVSPSLGAFDLSTFVFFMWVGRVEIIPAIVLLLSFFERAYQPRES